ncbi:MAG TPA: ClbS/DfsB family four-helix bundle protein [Aggregatilineales bacterium]|mgnify:CR=1 FL=1|jgi:hypothetical protein|nr:ClbS/DfsB family four-helix bundle protein [Chloroflexota bacterium]HOA22651.1 ClbS/DfsB family four-helix bundle protein [Aggregatilineales bacterium]HPV05991.1 ClbS/DfsB family four-helix bundle protein [Aggregatilineales bacterium]HQA69054.1 ClbS/DfsB family four-helix bundle protein [Aggregatilineales bacterium]
MHKFDTVSRDDLLATIQREREKWDALLAQLDEQSMVQPYTPGSEWTVKDVIAHVMAYERWIASILNPAIEPPPPFPPEVNAINTDERNAWFYQFYRDRPLDELRASAREAYEGMLEGIRRLNDEEINQYVTVSPDDRLVPGGSGMPEQFLRPLWKWIAEQSYEHYEQHYDALRAFVASQQAG